ncbi:MAG: hypothetical protein ACO1QB_10235 [Verrucomicrobiales bacterium]
MKFSLSARSSRRSKVKGKRNFAAIWKAALSSILFIAPPALAKDFPDDLGPIFSSFGLTLTPGERTEVLGPLYFSQDEKPQKLFVVPPLISYYQNPLVPSTEIDLLYPVLTIDKYGDEYRFQIFQLLSMGGGAGIDDKSRRRLTLFPFYFQQRSENPEQNYTAFLPFYGRLKNRLFRDEIFFIMLPAYLQSKKRDVVTDNYLFPIVHLREGNGLKGWQVWPIVGTETKQITLRTNGFGDIETMPGHKKFFGPWPFYINNTIGIGTTNVEKQLVLAPFYTSQKSLLRETVTYGFPLGFTRINDREKNFKEWGAPWPFIAFSRGPGKHMNRVWPLFSQASNTNLISNFYLWPFYKYNGVRTEQFERDRTRFMLFLYSDVSERNIPAATEFRRRDFWPLYTHRKDHNGNERTQALSLLEPLIPNNKSIERNYSHLYSIWRDEKNRKTGQSSQSLLWNLYRREKNEPENSSRQTALFGLFQYEKNNERRRVRLFYLPWFTRELATKPALTNQSKTN